MSTNIVIDGYNLIRQSAYLSALESISLEEGRKGLLRLLSAYKRAKGHSVTVVFDGWRSDNFGQSRDRIGGVNVIYSERGEKADDVIKRIADKMRGKVVVVTSDRGIASFAERRGVAVVTSPEFEIKVRDGSPATDTGTEICDGDEDAGERAGTKKKGPSRRLSKKERKKRSALKKL